MRLRPKVGDPLVVTAVPLHASAMGGKLEESLCYFERVDWLWTKDSVKDVVHKC